MSWAGLLNDILLANCMIGVATEECNGRAGITKNARDNVAWTPPQRDEVGPRIMATLKTLSNSTSDNCIG